MKVHISRSSDTWGNGKVEDFQNLQECIDTLFKTENFGRFGIFKPEIIVSKADNKTVEKYGECEYEVEIYDDYRE